MKFYDASQEANADLGVCLLGVTSYIGVHRNSYPMNKLHETRENPQNQGTAFRVNAGARTIVDPVTE